MYNTAALAFLGETSTELNHLEQQVENAPYNVKHAAQTAALHFRQLVEKTENGDADAATIKQVSEAAQALTEYVFVTLKGDAARAAEFKEATDRAEAIHFHITATLAGPVLCW